MRLAERKRHHLFGTGTADVGPVQAADVIVDDCDPALGMLLVKLPQGFKPLMRGQGEVHNYSNRLDALVKMMGLGLRKRLFAEGELRFVQRVADSKTHGRGNIYQ